MEKAKVTDLRVGDWIQCPVNRHPERIVHMGGPYGPRRGRGGRVWVRTSRHDHNLAPECSVTRIVRKAGVR